MGKSKFQISRSLDERIKRIISGSGSSERDSEFAQATSAYILGFNYGNITNCVGLTTNYKLQHAIFPVVGLAFFKSSPTDDDIKASLKAVKDFSSSPNGLGSFKADKNEHLFLIYSVDKETTDVEKRIFNFTKGAFVVRKRLRLTIHNDPYCPRHVYDGTEDVFNLDDGDSLSSSDDDQIEHLIFFIHGVGGVCDVRFRSCVEVVADFKKMANNLLAQHSNPSSGSSTPTNRHLAQHLKKGLFRRHSAESSSGSHSSGESPESLGPSPLRSRTRRVECLPISWHSLTRRQSGVSEQLNQIALSSVPKLRNFLNKVVMDALLYSSGPIYTQSIVNNVGNEINRLYTLFKEKHPNFNGSVSLSGHSLGSVIVFDLLAHQLGRELHESACSADLTDAENSILSTSGMNNNRSIPNNNNNNNDNNNHKSNFGSYSMNTRQRCFNVAHLHHSDAEQSDNRYCSDYKNLEELLKDMGLTQYEELFHKEHIDINSLLLLTDLDLKELRLPLGARRKLGTYINFKRASRVPLASSEQHTNSGQQQDSCEQEVSGGGEQRQYRSASMTSNHTNSSGGADLFGNMNTGQYLVEYPQLKFKPRCFFAFGSPTAMFLNVRGIQCIGKDYKLPTCDRMFNIFHPYDPLAYRMEPLIDIRFKNIEPVQLAHHRGGKRMHVQLRESFARVGHDIKHRLFGSLRNTWTSFTTSATRSNIPADEVPPAAKHTDPTPPSKATAKGAAGKQRLTKSTSSSLDNDADSFESCCSNLNSSGGTSGNGSTKMPKLKRPLKRQQELCRSQSDTNGMSSGLSSIIESPVAMAQMDSPIHNPAYPGSPDALANKMDSSMVRGAGEEPKSSQVAAAFNDAAASTCAQKATSPATRIPAGISEMHNDENQRTNAIDDNGGTVPPGGSNTNEPPEFDPSTIGRLNGGLRIDYVLQEKPMELLNEYIFAFTSHANYWQNEDSALVMLNEIYRIDGVQLFE